MVSMDPAENRTQPLETITLPMSNESNSGKMSSMFVAIVIPLALIVSWIFYAYVLGDPANFEGGDPIKGHPVEAEPAHTFGIIHKGGFIVPILITVNLL